MPIRRTIAIVAAFSIAAVAAAQQTLDNPVGTFVDLPFDSGIVDNNGPDFVLAFSQEIAIGDAAWLTLYFDEVSLPGGSFIRTSSVQDGEHQDLDAQGVGMWNNTTAYFNGDTVMLELYAAPGTVGNRVVLSGVLAELGQVGNRGHLCGICGVNDRRVRSDEMWTGRLMPVGCTASVYCEDSAMVSAGHCMGNANVIHFNVPDSRGNCATQAPPVADQFPIILKDGVNGGVGNDYAVMLPGLNSLGETPYERYGELRPIAESPANVGQIAGVWGYGVDEHSCIDSQTQQTHSGSIVGRTGSYYDYNIDVTFGNSGSALIHNGEIIGVVTHCRQNCPNIATRVDVAGFAQRIQDRSNCPQPAFIVVFMSSPFFIPIEVSPADLDGLGDGLTPFDRRYFEETMVTAIAPEEHDGRCFVEWEMDGVSHSTDPSMTFEVTHDFQTVTAIYTADACDDCRVDLNGDGTVNTQDFTIFLNLWSAGDPQADWNGDTVINTQDFVEFLNEWSAAVNNGGQCP